MKLLNFCLFVILIVLLTQPRVVAQSVSPKYSVEGLSGSCEVNNRYIDELVGEAKKTKERIFVIAIPSQKEKYKINGERLGYALTVLTQIKRVDFKQVTAATGIETTEKNGRVEFYLGSQLFLVSFAEKNKQICLLCCDTP